MKIFLAWSGERSHAVAAVFEAWLPEVIQSVDPWLSSEAAAKGASWLQELKQGLSASGGMALFFLSAEALDSPWMLFEAGGVAALEPRSVCTVLVGIAQAELKPPFGLFQGMKLDKTDLARLVQDINGRLPQRLAQPLLDKAFERAWPEFEQQLKAALEGVDAREKASDEEQPSFFGGDLASPLESSVEATARTVRGIEARLGRLEEQSQKSSMHLVHQVASLSALLQAALPRQGLFAAPPAMASNGFAANALPATLPSAPAEAVPAAAGASVQVMPAAGNGGSASAPVVARRSDKKKG
jgi:hypothetical protein